MNVKVKVYRIIFKNGATIDWERPDGYQLSVNCYPIHINLNDVDGIFYLGEREFHDREFKG